MKILSMTCTYLTVEDSGTEVERRPLVRKVPSSNPVISGFCLWDFSTQTARVLVNSSLYVYIKIQTPICKYQTASLFIEQEAIKH